MKFSDKLIALKLYLLWKNYGTIQKNYDTMHGKNKGTVPKTMEL